MCFISTVCCWGSLRPARSFGRLSPLLGQWLPPAPPLQTLPVLQPLILLRPLQSPPPGSVKHPCMAQRRSCERGAEAPGAGFYGSPARRTRGWRRCGPVVRVGPPVELYRHPVAWCRHPLIRTRWDSPHCDREASAGAHWNIAPGGSWRAACVWPVDWRGPSQGLGLP